MICTNLQNMAAFVRAAALGWCGVHVFTTYVGSIVVVSKSQGEQPRGRAKWGKGRGSTGVYVYECDNVTAVCHAFLLNPPHFF